MFRTSMTVPELSPLTEPVLKLFEPVLPELKLLEPVLPVLKLLDPVLPVLKLLELDCEPDCDPMALP